MYKPGFIYSEQLGLYVQLVPLRVTQDKQHSLYKLLLFHYIFSIYIV